MKIWKNAELISLDINETANGVDHKNNESKKNYKHHNVDNLVDTCPDCRAYVASHGDGILDDSTGAPS